MSVLEFLIYFATIMIMLYIKIYSKIFTDEKSNKLLGILTISLFTIVFSIYFDVFEMSILIGLTHFKFNPTTYDLFFELIFLAPITFSMLYRLFFTFHFFASTKKPFIIDAIVTSIVAMVIYFIFDINVMIAIPIGYILIPLVFIPFSKVNATGNKSLQHLSYILITLILSVVLVTTYKVLYDNKQTTHVLWMIQLGIFILLQINYFGNVSEYGKETLSLLNIKGNLGKGIFGKTTAILCFIIFIGTSAMILLDALDIFKLLV